MVEVADAVHGEALPGRLLDLLELPEADRLHAVRLAGDPEGVLIAFCEEVEQLAAGEVALALTASEALVTLANAVHVPRAHAEALGARAMILAYAGQFAESLQVCAEAVDLSELHGLVVAAARSRLAAVHPLARLGRFDEALATGLAAREALREAREPLLAARADVSLGAVHDMHEDSHAALAHYDRALLVLRQDAMVAAQIETNRGIALMNLDRFVEAEAAFTSALEVFEDQNLHWAAGVAAGNLAAMAARQGRLERALYNFERGRRALEADEAPGDLARLLAEHAAALVALGMSAEAVTVLEHALPALEEFGLVVELAQARASLGKAQILQGQLPEAELSLTLAADAFEALDQTLERARLDLTRSELAAALGREDEAWRLAHDAHLAFAPDSVDAAAASEILARGDLGAGRADAALARATEALAIAETFDLAPLRARALHTRGLTKRAQGENALPDLRQAVRQIERVRGALQADRFRSSFLGSNLALYEDAVLAALDAGPQGWPEAFAFVELARGRTLLDQVAHTLDLVEPAVEAADASLLSDLTRIRSELNWHYSRLDQPAGGVNHDVDPFAWQETTRRLENEFAALEDRLAIARGAAALYAVPADLNQVLAVLPAETALIEFFLAGDELVAFVLSGGEVRVKRSLASRHDIAQRVQRIRFQVSRAIASSGRVLDATRGERMLADMQRELAAAYEQLVAPCRADIGDVKRLVIVPHGPLHGLPFNALRDGEGALIERYEITVVPSASVLCQLRPAGASTDLAAAGAPLVVGVADDQAPEIATEARVIARLVAGRLLLNAEATSDRVAHEAAAASIIHLATHGRFIPGQPLASGLRLGDRWLTIADIYRLRLASPLVVLSGCETGRTAVTDGDELMGLTRAFLAAGAASLVYSLWLANDESTVELMTRFYTAYRNGQPPAAALRTAQLHLMVECAHPAFWAPFQAGGKG